MNKLKKILFLVVFLFSSIFLWKAVSSVNINRFSCTSQYGECSNPVREKINVLGQCNLLDCKKKLNQAFSEVWMVDKYSWQIKIPLEIEVRVLEKKPVYSIRTEKDNFFVQIDADGLVLDSKPESNLPGFSVFSDIPKPGEKVTKEQLNALRLIMGVSEIQEIENVKYENGQLFVNLKDGIRLLLPTGGDRDFILGALTLILNELKKTNDDSKIGLEEVKEIDLRYNNPIIR